MKIVNGLLLLISLTTLVHAQSYSIDWFKVAGGGGTSTNGQYSVSGTIGQHDAGEMNGGNYSLSGGFWGSFTAVQTPGAPLLSILRTTTNTVVVSWPSSSTGFNLQQNTNGLGSLNWSDVASGIQDNGTTKYWIVSTSAGNRFYRLVKP